MPSPLGNKLTRGFPLTSILSPFTGERKGEGVEALQERAALYLLFARIFREAPTPKLLREIVRRGLLPSADPRWSHHLLSPPKAERAKHEGPSGPNQVVGWPRQAEAIAVEHARLFAVPSDQAVRPYESVYCDTLTVDTSTACSAYFQPEPPAQGLPGFLHGPSCVAVRQAYAKAGFDLDSSARELPDHLAIELEFMGRLLERGDAEPARLFFEEHLGRWVFRCLGEISRKAGSGFYQAAADSLSAFLRRDRLKKG